MKAILRDYQTEALDAFLGAVHGTIKAHPGSGKTIIACAIIEALTARKAGPPRVSLPAGLTDKGPFLTLVVTPTIDLVNQWNAVLTEQGIVNTMVITYARAARIVTEREESPHANSAQWFKHFDLLVFDEAHHLQEGPVYMRLLIPALQAPYALGLTSTPPTDIENPLLRVMPVIYEYTFAEGLDEGRATPIEVRPVPVKLSQEERAKYLQMTETIQSRIARYAGGDLKRAVRHPMVGPLITERKQLVSMAEAKFAKLHDLLTEILRLDTCGLPDDDAPTRVFVWSEYLDALAQAKEVLNRNGPIAELVSGKTPKKERKRILTEAWGTEFPVLLIAKIGEEGIDYPEVAHGIVLAGAKTSRQAVQRIGRLLRPFPGKEKAVLWVIFAERTTDEKLLHLIDMVTDQ